MKKSLRTTIVVSAVLLMVLVAAPARQANTEEQSDPKPPEIKVQRADPKMPYKWIPIPDTEVRPGQTVPIIVGKNRALFLIPSTGFKPLENVTDWVVTKSFTVFKVSGRTAQIKLDECFPPGEMVINYSVLAQEGNDPPGSWDYVHGENPPPRIRIP